MLWKLCCMKYIFWHLIHISSAKDPFVHKDTRYAVQFIFLVESFGLFLKLSWLWYLYHSCQILKWRFLLHLNNCSIIPTLISFIVLRDVFRRLFGQPTDQESCLKVIFKIHYTSSLACQICRITSFNTNYDSWKNFSLYIFLLHFSDLWELINVSLWILFYRLCVYFLCLWSLVDQFVAI